MIRNISLVEDRYILTVWEIRTDLRYRIYVSYVIVAVRELSDSQLDVNRNRFMFLISLRPLCRLSGRLDIYYVSPNLSRVSPLDDNSITSTWNKQLL